MITKNPKNILIADDSVFFRTKLSDILTEAGHRVLFAKDGREVMKEIATRADFIDLLILDLQMPDLDGFAVLEWMKENGRHGAFPVLAVTGVYEPGDVTTRLRELGGSGLMTKDATPEQIIFRINRILFRDKAEEKRGAQERVPVSIPVDFTVGDRTKTGYLLNISEGGVFLHTKEELMTGTSVQLRFSLPGSEDILDIKGIVRWTTAEVAKKTLFGGSGIMFSTISEVDQRAIRVFVSMEKKRLNLG